MIINGITSIKRVWGAQRNQSSTSFSLRVLLSGETQKKKQQKTKKQEKKRSWTRNHSWHRCSILLLLHSSSTIKTDWIGLAGRTWSLCCSGLCRSHSATSLWNIVCCSVYIRYACGNHTPKLLRDGIWTRGTKKRKTSKEKKISISTAFLEQSSRGNRCEREKKTIDQSAARVPLEPNGYWISSLEINAERNRRGGGGGGAK